MKIINASCYSLDLSRKTSNYLLLFIFHPNVGKAAYAEKRSALNFNIRKNILFWKI